MQDDVLACFVSSQYFMAIENIMGYYKDLGIMKSLIIQQKIYLRTGIIARLQGVMKKLDERKASDRH